MSRKVSYAEQVAANLLRRYGLAVVWQLELAAAKAHRNGNRLAAMSIAEVADAAERQMQRRRDHASS